LEKSAQAFTFMGECNFDGKIALTESLISQHDIKPSKLAVLKITPF